MGTKSQFFRVFVEGNTISDGRTITAEMIDEIVSTFNVDTYTPRINIEHIAGYSPEPPFNGYGDVIAVKAQVDDIVIDGKTVKRKALYARVDANDQLVKLAKADQKPFPSVELTPSYAGISKIGLIGLAFTDKPASIATQRLKFSATGTFYAYANEAAAIEFETAPASEATVEGAVAGFFSALAAKFKSAEAEKPKEEPKPAPTPANDNFAAFATAMGETVAASIGAAIKPVTEAQAAFQSKLDALTTQLENTDDGQFSRKPATGGSGVITTDC